MTFRDIRWPTGLMAVAFGLLAIAYLVSSWNDPRPLLLSVPIQPGVVQSTPFQVDQTLPYLIELEVDRLLPFNELQCLLGEQPADQDCSGSPDTVRLEWRIFQASKPVASGVSRPKSGAGYGPTLEKTLGTFDAERGVRYTLEVSVLRSLERLRPANPRVVVQLHPIHTKGAYVLSAALGYVALPLLLGAGIWLLVRVFTLRSRANAA